MNWEQKLDALNKLTDCSLFMRAPGDWMVLQQVEVKDHNLMIGICGNGSSPEAAVEDHWKQVTDNLKGRQFVVARSGSPFRAAVRWNGFMWSTVDETAARGKVRV